MVIKVLKAPEPLWPLQGHLSFYYDCSSPWTYLAFAGLDKLVEETGIIIDFKPVLVGGIFNSVNQTVYASRSNPDKRKARYSASDMQHWAAMRDIKIKWPPSIFPVNSVKAMRSCRKASEIGKIKPWSKLLFKAYWSEDQDISDTYILKTLWDNHLSSDVRWSEVEADIQTSGCKQWLIDQTQEVIDAGGFGSPTMILDNGDLHFGNDRLPLISHQLQTRQNKKN